ncbi:MAG: bifunctional nuclease family protein, partial [Anaerolineae bacterium]|nr:bifunctional nuclease family protein [Anaerolineae bacterium]
MIEVIIDSIRVSLMSQHRIVILKDTGSDRYLPIWIG